MVATKLISVAKVDSREALFRWSLEVVASSAGPQGPVAQEHIAGCQVCQEAPEGRGLDLCPEARAIYELYAAARRLQRFTEGRLPPRSVRR